MKIKREFVTFRPTDKVRDKVDQAQRHGIKISWMCNRAVEAYKVSILGQKPHHD